MELIKRRVIWKFELQPATRIRCSADYRILCVQMQRGKPCVWIQLTPGEPDVEITLKCYKTGYDIDYDIKEYVGTFQWDDLVYHKPIYHVYRVGEDIWL